MQNRRALLLFLAFVACAAAFVWLTSQALPELVASHFGSSGVANGFMPRVFYIRFMLAFVIVLPLFLAVVTSISLGSRNARINLPNRDYWLAPERRAETISVLRLGVMKFVVMLVVFLCYAHWLVVRANETNPAHLSAPWFLGGLVVFLVAALVWVTAFLVRFRIRP